MRREWTRGARLCVGGRLGVGIGQVRPDCLVLDVHMPGLNGLETQLWLRERGIHIPSIMITGRTDDTMRTRSIAAGACAYLSKPVDASVLIGAIANAIRESHFNISLS